MVVHTRHARRKRHVYQLSSIRRCRSRAPAATTRDVWVGRSFPEQFEYRAIPRVPDTVAAAAIRTHTDACGGLLYDAGASPRSGANAPVPDTHSDLICSCTGSRSKRAIFDQSV